MTENKYIIKQGYKYEGDEWWQWWIWIDGTDIDLDKIQKVIYNLHSSFLKPVRTVKNRNTKFKLQTAGWGTFTIFAKVVLNDGEEIKLRHNLILGYEKSSDSYLVKSSLGLNKQQKIFIGILAPILAFTGFFFFKGIGLVTGMIIGICTGLYASKIYRKIKF